MERYLTEEEIRKYPAEKKYKKSSYGGRKIFMKKELIGSDDLLVELEFYYRNNKWRIEKKDRLAAQKRGVDNNQIRKSIRSLNKDIKERVIDLSPDRKSYKALYNDYADADQLGYYKKTSPEFVRVKNILENINNDSIVYDVGCNSGGIGNILIKEKKCKVFGSEICPKLAEKAIAKGIEIFCGWAEKIPFRSNQFCTVIMSFILEHVVDPKKVMRESLRVLKEGGIVLGHVPTEFGDWGKKTIGKHPEHLRAYSRRELEDFLKGFNLKIVSIEKERLVGRRIADYYFFKAIK